MTALERILSLPVNEAHHRRSPMDGYSVVTGERRAVQDAHRPRFADLRVRDRHDEIGECRWRRYPGIGEHPFIVERQHGAVAT